MSEEDVLRQGKAETRPQVPPSPTEWCLRCPREGLKWARVPGGSSRVLLHLVSPFTPCPTPTPKGLTGLRSADLRCVCVFDFVFPVSGIIVVLRSLCSSLGVSPLCARAPRVWVCVPVSPPVPGAGGCRCAGPVGLLGPRTSRRARERLRPCALLGRLRPGGASEWVEPTGPGAETAGAASVSADRRPRRGGRGVRRRPRVPALPRGWRRRRRWARLPARRAGGRSRPGRP